MTPTAAAQEIGQTTPLRRCRDHGRVAGNTYTGVTDAYGVFRTGWAMNIRSGTYYADAVDLALQDYIWDHSLDLEDDSDGDGKVDGVLYR